MKKIVALFLITGILPFCENNVGYGQLLLPIKPERTASFEVTEGSYMNVDISADGRTLVFDLLGDIYKMPADGGKAVQLTHGLAYNRCPVWSPDGKQIAYLSDASGSNRLSIMNADGTEQRTLDLSMREINTSNPLQIELVPAWTPDGEYIAVDGQLYHLAGGHMSLPLTKASNIQFSADGLFSYYFRDTLQERCLARFDRSTGEIVNLTSLTVYDQFASDRVSPDGLWLAYVTGPKPECSLRLRNLATGEDRLLVEFIQGHSRDFKERFTFTPDSRSVLIGYNGKLHRINIQTDNDRIIPFQAQVRPDLGAFNYNTYRLNNDSFHVQFTRSANVSPDGKTLVFVALNHIYRMSIPVGMPHLLVNQSFGQFQPAFSPDGKWITYVTWSDTQGGAVWRVATAGGKPEKLTELSGYYMNPCLSYDDRMVAVMRDSLSAQAHGIYQSAIGDLEIIDIDSRRIHELADSIPIWNHLSFSPDGTSLTAMVCSGYQKANILESFRIDGGKKHIIAIRGNKELVNTGFVGMQQVTISPDNRYIVYEINEDLYISPLSALVNPVTINSDCGIRPAIRFACGGLDPTWEQSGKILSWSYGHKYYRINPDKIMQMAIRAAEDSARAGVPNNGIIQLNVIPDETIDMDVKACKLYGHGTIVLSNVRVISMKGDEVIENGTIIITDGRIASVRPGINNAIPRGAKIFNLKGRTIMPGMIDLHDHCFNPPGVFVEQSWKYLANLAYGVTTARDPAASYDAFGYSELLQTGQMVGPRLFGVGYAVGEGYLIVNSVKEARETARKRAELGAIVLKQYDQETRLRRQWLLMACRESGLNMTNEGDYDLRGELAMIKDGSTGVEHAYQWCNIYQDVIKFIANSGTWHTATLQVTTDAQSYYRNLYRQKPDNKLERFWPKRKYLEIMKTKMAPADTVHPDFVYTSSIEGAIYKQGGHIGLGAHGNDPGIGSHWELWALQRGGLSNLEALKVATISGAEALGLQKDLGSIEPGKIADLIVLDKNPLDNIQNTLTIQYVMKDGVLYDGNTLNTIWPIKKRLPE